MKTRTRILLTAIFSQGLCGLAIAESWTTTGSGNGDPLTFNGSAGTVVSIDGFRTGVVNSAATNGAPYSSPKARAWSEGVGVQRVNSQGSIESSDPHTLGNNANDWNWADGILLSFAGKQVSISDVTLTSANGWGAPASWGDTSARDQDFELWAFTGDGTGALPTASYSMWGSNDWTKVAAIDGDRAGSSGILQKTYSTSNSAYSSYWIVLAANATNDKDHALDAFKFKSFSATHKPSEGPGQVPVPGTLALLAIGALAVRRKLAKA